MGFSVPFPRLPATFTYEGALPVGEVSNSQGDTWQSTKNLEQVVIDHQGASYSNHWIILRDPSKPIIHDHLGF